MATEQPNVEYVGASAYETGLPDGCSDVVTASQSLHWMRPEDVYPEIDRMQISARFREPRLLYWNVGNGKFKDVSTTAGDAFQLPAVHRGSAIGDLDNDGRMDIVVAVVNGPAKIFHNVTQTSNHWILLQLRGIKSNRLGIGARIRLTGEDGSKQFNEAVFKMLQH